MDEIQRENMLSELYALIADINSQEDCRILFEDLCTNKELEQMAQRLKAAKLLKSGLTYAKVIEATEISSATLSRVSRCLQYGKGYKKFLKD